MRSSGRGPVFVLAASVGVALGCSAAEPAPASSSAPASTLAPASSLPDRDPALAHRLVEQEGALLLDVRSPEEFAQEHLPGAHNVPHTEIDARWDELATLVGPDPNRPIVVYCRSGRRSGIAKEALLAQGYRQITNLGGISDW
ncbi:rhodanese-like domain-containing protein [Paraliomyxa miuraensis]|uniref:rhodanese-like domain-containing protein n=1 Tax=Paraliomyxa miuraensis TaxID=376150 RepID=UPI00224E310D|nr:rhodanese-like domain-containing protein [Paraliomyxa miuraensis]MCX4243576.1 rhodanese-like domain-containing protein [Paraliomyxa miuraensis]